ncbi:MAG: hypothetical protein AB7M12_02145 [Hyphomonadaceae bacterium]
MGELVVAYAKADETAADLVVAKLEKRGYTVKRSAGAQREGARRLNGAAASAPPVLVLWSREYAHAARPATLKSARLALRLDAAPPSPLLKAPAIDLRAWRGRDDHRGWRKVVSSLGEKSNLSRGAKSMKAKSAAVVEDESILGKNEGRTLVGTLAWSGVLVALLAGVAAAWHYLIR